MDKVPDIEIVGVVKDAKYTELRESQHRHFYVSAMQAPRLFEMTLQVRAAGDPGALAGIVRAQVNSLIPAFLFMT